MVTFDYSDEVFQQENVIYKLTDEEDAFVIVQLVEPEKLGYQYKDENEQNRPVVQRSRQSSMGLHTKSAEAY